MRCSPEQSQEIQSAKGTILILALELLLVLKAVHVLSFSGITIYHTTDICLCLVTCDQRRI